MLLIIFLINENKFFTTMDFLRNFLQKSLGVILEGAFILILIVALTVVAKHIIQNVYKHSKKRKGSLFMENFTVRLMRPIKVMIWLVGLSYLGYIFVVRLQLQNSFQSSFGQFRNLVIIVCSTWLAFEIKKQLIHSWFQRNKYSGVPPDKAKIGLVSKLVSSTLMILAVLVTLSTLGVHIGALLTLGGIGGVTLGFAAKDVFANFFGGFMLHITRPFDIGDWIHSLDAKMQGTVEHIGFYLTRVRGFDKRPFYVPNSMFSSQITVNATRMTNRRIRTTVGIRYDDFHVIEPIVKDIRSMLKENKDIDDNQAQLVNFKEFGPSSLDIEIYTFTKSRVWKEWLQIQQDVYIGVGKIIEKHGAEIAFPTSTLHINNK
ncbi:MAG: Low conductance mechanosensitive channel YnaI [Chlamydiae bacterium]|nr:Low conductance mechanosensitive channel YnaI [Chlamydiota bacterium]